jgi:high affinity Mn2+ porin
MPRALCHIAYCLFPAIHPDFYFFIYYLTFAENFLELIKLKEIGKVRVFGIFIVLGLSCSLAVAQQTDTLKNDRFTIHAQTTIINQFKPGFSADYSGKNSLTTGKEDKTSITSTLFLGARLWNGASVFLDPELGGGFGLSQTLGIAAAPNGETYRIGDPAPAVYIARFFFRQVFSLSKKKTYQETDFNHLGQYIPDKYLAFTIGKIGITDYFDDNKYSHDPRTQFMSWALMDNGAWDYPANTRGYSPSIVLEFVSTLDEIRYAFSLVPLTANGSDMNWNFLEANSNSLEYTRHYKLNKKSGAVRISAFFTTANMGNYRESLALNPLAPVIENTRAYGHTKYGLGLNAEQDINDFMGCFFRAGWNDGNNETWAFTEIDHTVSAGFSMTGKKWKRNNDNLGLAYVASGISKPHRDYLQAGGYGFILGDGNLNYAWEHLAELYYSTELLKDHIYVTLAYQLVINPAYNEDRSGPVNILSVRLHAKI